MINFLKATNQAEKIAAQENPEGIRDFLKKIGSNFHIAERTLACELKKPWRVARSWHSVSLCDTPHSAVSGKSENWRREWDSNPRYVSVHTLSKRALSASQTSLHKAGKDIAIGF